WRYENKDFRSCEATRKRNQNTMHGEGRSNSVSEEEDRKQEDLYGHQGHWNWKIV
ncbi:12375_t:CDS:1, partial [Acaulospora colombiana]